MKITINTRNSRSASSMILDMYESEIMDDVALKIVYSGNSHPVYAIREDIRYIIMRG